jgi:hypothetical protein
MKHGKVREGGFEARGVGNAPQEEEDARERIGAQGDEPQAGDCDRFE